MSENKFLQHLDISYNKISYHDTLLISESLKTNHSLYGIHYEGNYGRIDSLGFLIPKETSNFEKLSISPSSFDLKPPPIGDGVITRI